MRNDLAKPYDWLVNRPDPNSQDFKDVMAWLATFGVPANPKISYIVLSAGGFQAAIDGVNPGPILQLTFDGYAIPMDGALVLNAPGVVVMMLGLDKGNTPLYTPPAPPAPDMPAPPSQPANPVGVPWYTTAQGVKIFQVATGDTSPAGTLYPHNASPTDSLWIKELIPGPFGNWQDWKQIR